MEFIYRVSRGEPEYQMRGGAMTGQVRRDVAEYATWDEAVEDFRIRLESIDQILFGDNVDCECDELDDQGELCEPCLVTAYAKAWLRDGPDLSREVELVEYNYCPDGFVTPVAFRIERVSA